MRIVLRAKTQLDCIYSPIGSGGYNTRMGFLDGIRNRLGIELEGDGAAPREPVAQAAVLWERQPGEPDGAWSLFSAYLQSPSANVTRFAAGANAAGMATATIQAYASRWRWHARRAALEGHLARARAESAEDAARAQGEQIAGAVQNLLDQADRAAAAFEARGAIEEISAKDLLAMRKTAIELARLLRGEVTARTAIDLSGLSDQELAAYRALIEKTGG